MEARGGGGGREGKEREKGKRLGGPRLRSRTECSKQLLSIPTTQSLQGRGQAGGHGPAQCSTERAKQHQGQHGQVHVMNGKWGKRSGTHLFDFTLSLQP